MPHFEDVLHLGSGGRVEVEGIDDRINQVAVLHLEIAVFPFHLKLTA